MYLRGAQRVALGQDDGIDAVPSVDSTVATGSVLTNPVSLSVSPLMLAGLGLFFFASLAHFTKRTTGAISRKTKAVKRALRA